MKKDKFLITNLIKNLIYSFDKYLTNFPHEYIELKKNIMNTSYEMLKIAYEANNTYDRNKRIDIQDKMIAFRFFNQFLL